MSEQIQSPSPSLIRTCLWLLILGLITTFLIYFRGLLVPFIFAVITAYLINELTLLTGKITIKGKPAPGLVRGIMAFLIVIGIFMVIIEIMVANVDQIMVKAPEYQETLNNLISQIGILTGAEDISTDIREQISALNFEALISDIFSSFSLFLGNLFLVIIYSIFLLMEIDVGDDKLDAIFKEPKQRREIQMIMNRINDSVRQYLSVKTVASLITGLLSYGILVLFGVDFPVLWAFLLFLFNYIPYIGSMIATLLPSFLAVFQFESILMGLWIFLSIQAVQTIIGSILEPKFAGKTLNLSPLVVLLSLSFWGAIWGIVGMTIAVPVTSIMVIVLAEFPSTRNAAILMSERGSVSFLTED